MTNCFYHPLRWVQAVQREEPIRQSDCRWHPNLFSQLFSSVHILLLDVGGPDSLLIEADVTIRLPLTSWFKPLSSENSQKWFSLHIYKVLLEWSVDMQRYVYRVMFIHNISPSKLDIPWPFSMLFHFYERHSGPYSPKVVRMFVLPFPRKVSDQKLENNLFGTHCHSRSPPTCNRPLADSANSICHRIILPSDQK